MSIHQDQPAFFVRGPSPFARVTFFGLLALLLMFIDSRYRYLEVVRKGVATLVYPLQQAALMPAEAWRNMGHFFETRDALRLENSQLKQASLDSARAVQGHEAAVAEAKQLRALLRLPSTSPIKHQAARVLYSGRDPFQQKIFIDRGQDSALQTGQAVMDGNGVIGQITRVYPLLSEVTLITEKDHAVPVQVVRTGVRTVLFGRGAGKQPELRYLANNVDLKEGDTLVTSGIDGVYPPQLAVAKVVQIQREAKQSYAVIACEPLAGVTASDTVLILDLAAPTPPLPPIETTQATPNSKRRR
jgi:rod shape-determining protein MreC